MQRFLLILVYLGIVIAEKAQCQDTAFHRNLEVDTPEWLQITVYDSMLRIGKWEYRSVSALIGESACEISVLKERGVNWTSHYSATILAEYMFFHLHPDTFNNRLFRFLSPKKGGQFVADIKKDIKQCAFCGCDSNDKSIIKRVGNGQVSFGHQQSKLSDKEEVVFIKCIGRSWALWEHYEVGISFEAPYTNSGDSLVAVKRLEYLENILVVESGFDKTLVRFVAVRSQSSADANANKVMFGLFYPDEDDYDPDVFKEEEP